MKPIDEVLADLGHRRGATPGSVVPITTYVDPAPEPPPLYADWAQCDTLGIPPLFRKAEWEDFTPADLAGGEMPLVTSNKRSLLIVGKNGCGKSHLAAAIARMWRARWVSAAQFVVECRSTFGRSGGDSELAVIERYSDVGCLALDDLTGVGRTEYAAASLLALLDKRIGWQRPTVITTYQGPSDVIKLDPSIASRVAGFEKIILVGGDRRGNP